MLLVWMKRWDGGVNIWGGGERVSPLGGFSVPRRLRARHTIADHTGRGRSGMAMRPACRFLYRKVMGRSRQPAREGWCRPLRFFRVTHSSFPIDRLSPRARSRAALRVVSSILCFSLSRRATMPLPTLAPTASDVKMVVVFTTANNF